MYKCNGCGREQHYPDVLKYDATDQRCGGTRLVRQQPNHPPPEPGTTEPCPGTLQPVEEREPE